MYVFIVGLRSVGPVPSAKEESGTVSGMDEGYMSSKCKTVSRLLPVFE